MQCPNYPTTCQADLIFHAAKKHGTSRSKTTDKRKICLGELSEAYALLEHRSSQHGISVNTFNPDEADNLLEDIDDTETKVNLGSCKHSSVDFELQKGWDSLFNIARSNIITSLHNGKWIKCSVHSNEQPKSNLHSNLFHKTSIIERVDTFMHKKNNRKMEKFNLQSCVHTGRHDLSEKEFAKNGYCW